MTPQELLESELKPVESPSTPSAKLEEELFSDRDSVSAEMVGQQDLGPPGLEDTRARIGLADANTAGEKLIAFRRVFPKGDIAVAPVTHELLFREDESKPYAKVDAGMMEKFEPMGDLIDFIAPDFGAIVGEIALTKGAGSLIGTLGRLVMGTFAGDVAQQGVQEARGVNEESFSDMAGRAGAKGAVSAGAGVAGMAVGKVANTIRGGGFLAKSPGADQASAAAERLGIPGLTPGQSTDVPLVQSIEGQAGAALPTIQRYFDTQNIAATAVLNRMKDQKSKLSISSDLDVAVNRARGDALSQGTAKAFTRTEGGQSIQKGIREYDDLARVQIDKSFSDARALGRPEFDLTDVFKVADDLDAGVMAAGEENLVKVSGRLDPELQSVINDIKKLDKSLPDVKVGDRVATNIDQLRALRERLFDLKTPEPGGIFRRNHADAGRLYSALTNTLNNPSVIPDPKFGQMWKKANRQAAERFSTLEKLTVIRAAKSETPAELAFRLGQPNQVDNLVTLRGTISSKRFSEFQDSFKTDLLSDADKLTSRISAFDRPTLNMLLSREEQNIYRRIGKSIDSINDTRIRSVIDAQTESGAIIHDLLLNGKTASINKIHEIVEKSGGKESPLGKSIRAGIIDSIADKTIRRSRGSKVIDPNALEKSIAELEKKGLLRFLNRSDVEQLADLDKVAPFLKVKSDTGTSIQKATTAANTRGAIVGVLTGQGFAGSAISTVLEHLGVGTLFTSKVGRWLLTGNKTIPSKDIAPRLSAALALSASDFDSIKPEDYATIKSESK